MKQRLMTSVALVSWVSAVACGRLGTDDVEVGDGDGDSASVGDGDSGGDGDDVGDGDVGNGDGDGDVGNGDGDVGNGDGDVGNGDGDVGDGDGDLSGLGGRPQSAEPECRITSPEDDSEIPFFGERTEFGAASGIYFSAQAHDREDGELSGESITWFLDSFDNLVGTGNELRIERLSPGEHKVYCQTVDSDGQTGLGYVHVRSLSPVVYIQHPGEIDGSYPAGELYFEAIGFDYDDGQLEPKHFFWESSVDGELGDGNGHFGLSAGEHEITVHAENSAGESSEPDAVHISVIPDDVVIGPIDPQPPIDPLPPVQE